MADRNPQLFEIQEYIGSIGRCGPSHPNHVGMNGATVGAGNQLGERRTAARFSARERRPRSITAGVQARF